MPRQIKRRSSATTGKRHPLNMRTTKDIRDRLEVAAAEAGRSLAQEVERRLEMSFNWEQALGEHQEWQKKHAADMKAIESGSTRSALRRLGWMPVATTKGRIWLEPNVPASAATEVVGTENLTTDLHEIIEQAVAVALRKAGIGRGEQ